MYFATILSKSILDDLVVIEILSVSCSVLFFSKGRWRPFVVPNCKKSKWLNAKIFPVLHPVIFSKARHLEGLFLFNFETTHLKNNFDTNLVKLFSGY